MDAFWQSNVRLGIILEFAIEDWMTNCRLKNADCARVLAQSNDGFGIILKFYWNLQLETGEPIVG